MKVFRLIVECDVEDDLDLVIGAVTGLDHFDGKIQVSIELVEKYIPQENPNDEDGENKD